MISYEFNIIIINNISRKTATAGRRLEGRNTQFCWRPTETASHSLVNLTEDRNPSILLRATTPQKDKLTPLSFLLKFTNQSNHFILACDANSMRAGRNFA